MLLPKYIKDVMRENETVFLENAEVASSSEIHKFSSSFNEAISLGKLAKSVLDAGDLAMFLAIDKVFHHLFILYEKTSPSFLEKTYFNIEKKIKSSRLLLEDTLILFLKFFPPHALYNRRFSPKEYLEINRYAVFKELIIFVLLCENPAISTAYASALSMFFDESEFISSLSYVAFKDAVLELRRIAKNQNIKDSIECSDDNLTQDNIISFLTMPFSSCPESLKAQLDYIKENWKELIKDILHHILQLESIAYEAWRANVRSGKIEGEQDWKGRAEVPRFFKNYDEYEAFSPDDEWMENTVLLAKHTYVYLDQLSKKYKKTITQIDEIPDEELQNMQEAGITALWLIGLMERSFASQKIKRSCGNVQAIASAYSIYDYKIAKELGGEEALKRLKEKAIRHGIRLSVDMVPNHTAIDSIDIIENPDLFLQTDKSPFPSYNFDTQDLSNEEGISIYLEKHYYDKSDCAVVFKRVDNKTKEVRYIFHGNDGTRMPWNDTAQLDFLNENTREHVIAKIIELARNFPIIRFDAAMVLTQRHIRRLWYPSFNSFDGVAGRATSQMSDEEFYSKIPCEFWREVVDRVAKEVPSTLFLAEAFWMLEGYFVRTLGMHRVYNSAFMNMLKDEENEKYRITIKNTILFDREVLKRYVNFMSNPDEETAVVQFGKGDKYFGVCTMMACLPGLPMFAHGQFYGFCEKYGMEYKKAYREEEEDVKLLERHRKEIFPLLRMRYLFSGVEHFYFYDVVFEGVTNQNVFCWSNMHCGERTLVCYNNKYECARGAINFAAPYKDSDGRKRTKSLFDALSLNNGDNYYTILYEMCSSLYYIRKNSELKEKGFFLMLKGFEAQVFLNIEEVCDLNETYAKICQMLDGKGSDKNIKLKKEILLTNKF